MQNIFATSRNRVLVTVSIVLLSSLATGQALARSGNPPDGRTNAPGEGNCTGCHTTYPLNSGSGSLSIQGLEADWQNGQTYDLSVILEDPDAQRWGFEMVIINGTGDSVGALNNLDGDVQISSSGSRTYAKHTSVGTHNGTTGNSNWTVRWTAPATDEGELGIYFVGNAANGNFNNSGDRIYAASAMWQQDSSSPVPFGLPVAKLHPSFPNPFNPRTTLAFSLAEAEPVRLTIYGLDGKRVATLIDGLRDAGRHEVVWNGLDTRGRAVSSGTYLYRLVSDSGTLTRTMTLVR